MNNGELGGFTSTRAPLRFLKIFGSGALVFIGLAVIAACSANQEPECGNENAEQLVIKIAREKSDNGLAIRLPDQIESYQSEVKQIQRRLEAAEQQIHQQATTSGELATRIDAAMNASDAEAMSAWNKILAKITRNGNYSLDTILTDDQNPQTKAVACSAKLTLMFDGHAADKEIRYKVEKTSEGKLYVTVFGL